MRTARPDPMTVARAALVAYAARDADAYRALMADPAGPAPPFDHADSLVGARVTGLFWLDGAPGHIAAALAGPDLASSDHGARPFFVLAQRRLEIVLIGLERRDVRFVNPVSAGYMGTPLSPSIAASKSSSPVQAVPA